MVMPRLPVLYPVQIFKGSIFLKNSHFLFHERFNKLIYGTNTIIKCGIWQPVKFQLVSCFRTGLKWKNENQKWNYFFYRISELVLATLIQWYNKKSFQEQETNWNFAEPQKIITVMFGFNCFWQWFWKFCLKFSYVKISCCYCNPI